MGIVMGTWVWVLTGIPPDWVLKMNDYKPLAKAMARFENGFLNDAGLNTAYILVTDIINKCGIEEKLLRPL